MKKILLSIVLSIAATSAFADCRQVCPPPDSGLPCVTICPPTPPPQPSTGTVTTTPNPPPK